MARVELRLLGPPAIIVDGQPVHVDTRKATALLAYATVEPSPRGRDVLAALLWPDSDGQRARAALRRTLSVLNAALNGNGLDITRGTVSVDRRLIDADVVTFDALVERHAGHGQPSADTCSDCVDDLEAALELYRGDFMAGFTLRDSAEFDDWQSMEAERRRRALLSALERLIRLHTARGALSVAVDRALRLMAVDPLHEPAHQQLIRLYAWSGDRNAAIAQYRACVAVLDRELGVEPLDETTELYRAVLDNRLGRPQRAPEAVSERSQEERRDRGPAALVVAGQPALVGRDAELGALVAAYRDVDADGHVVTVEGEAGIGKTRLIEAFLEQALDATHLHAQCYQGEAGLAYAPVAALLRAALADDACSARLAELPSRWLAEACRLVPELSEISDDVTAEDPRDDPAAQQRFVDAVANLLVAAVGGRRPGVVVLEDLHWADSATVDLVSYLCRRLPGRPILLVVSSRSDTGGPLLPPAHLTRVRLERLGRDDLDQLLQAHVPELVEEPGFAERLWTETEGLPFFVLQYLALLTMGDQEPEWSMPGPVQGLLHSQIAAVTAAASQVLSTAAVLGRSFDLDTVRAASGRGEEETVNALEELTRRGLVREEDGEDGTTYDFSHGLLRQTVYAETSLARRRLLHRRIGETLSERARSQPGAVAATIAEHLRLGGREVEASEWFAHAGDHARSVFANGEALNHYRAALALDHADTAAMHQAIGDLLTLQGDYREALAAYEAAAAYSDDALLPALEHKLGALHHRLGDWGRADSHFEAALARIHDAVLRARVLADRSLTAHHSGQPERALDLGRQALAVASDTGNPAALARARNVLGVLATSRGELDEAITQLDASLAIARELTDPNPRIAALNNLALARRRSGDLAAALALTEGALRECVNVGDRHREAALHNNIADLLHSQGDREGAMAHLKQAVGIFAEIGGDTGDQRAQVWKLVEW